MITDNVSYQNIEADFYDQQLVSPNPLRTWFHANRYYMIDMLVKAHWFEGARVVDFGCGSCNWNTAGIPVHGIDINPGMLQRGLQKGRLFSFDVSDIYQTPLASGSVDVAVISEVIEHLKDHALFFIELRRILKPEGVCIISVPFDTAFSLWRPLFFLQCFLHGFVLGDPYYRKQCGHIWHFSLQTLRQLLERNGFTVQDIFALRRFSIFAVACLPACAKPFCAFDDVTVLLPTLNEREAITRVIGYVREEYPGMRVIVCDDGSSDGTAQAVSAMQDSRLKLLDRSDAASHGLTASIIDGLQCVQTPFSIVADSDLQHPLEKIREINTVLHRGFDMVVGSRVRVPYWRLHRRLLTMLATFLGKLVLLMRRKSNFSYDILSGYWGGRTQFLRALIAAHRASFVDEGYKILFDALKIMPADTRIGEVFYEFQTRCSGESKLRLRVVIAFLKSLVR